MKEGAQQQKTNYQSINEKIILTELDCTRSSRYLDVNSIYMFGKYNNPWMRVAHKCSCLKNNQMLRAATAKESNHKNCSLCLVDLKGTTSAFRLNRNSNGSSVPSEYSMQTMPTYLSSQTPMPYVTNHSTKKSIITLQLDLNTLDYNKTFAWSTNHQYRQAKFNKRPRKSRDLFGYSS